MRCLPCRQISIEVIYNEPKVRSWVVGAKHSNQWRKTLDIMKNVEEEHASIQRCTLRKVNVQDSSFEGGIKDSAVAFLKKVLWKQFPHTLARHIEVQPAIRPIEKYSL